jgi:uncharacterized membrane protein YkvA (DUF1232 family)
MTPAGGLLSARQALRLAASVFEKARRHRAELGTAWNDLQSLARLVRAWARGEYRAVPWRSLAVVIGALVYFVNPFDAVPDFLPGLGLVDDATLIALLVGSIRGDLQNFAAWEEKK